MTECFGVLAAKNSNSRRAAVIFSSRNANGFSFFKLFEQFGDDLHRIYIRDPNDQWFDQGISADLTCWSDMEGAVRSSLEQLGADQVMTFGASMGGYASLRLASAIEAHSCLAFSPQTLLDRRLPHTPIGDVSDESRDLRILLDAWVPRNAAIFFGAADLVDVYNVFRMGRQDIDLFPVEGRDHLVIQHLVRSKAVQAMIADFVAKGAFTPHLRLQDKKIALDKKCYDEVEQRLISRIVEGFYLGAGWDVEAQLNALKSLNQWADAYHIEAKILVKRGALDEAAIAAEEALRLAPKSVMFSDTAAEIQVSKGNRQGAIDGYRRSLSLRAKHYQALCRLGELLAESGELGEATDMLRTAVETRPRQVRAKNIIRALGIDL